MSVEQKIQQPNAMWGWAIAMQAKNQENEARAKLDPDKNPSRNISDLSLGELNPLIHRPNLADLRALSYVTAQKIEQYGGLMPTIFETMLVYNPGNGTLLPRLIVRFELEKLDDNQLEQLEKLVAETYTGKVRTRMGADGKDVTADKYPPIHQGETHRSNTFGWYMGPNLAPTEPTHTGLFVYRDDGEVTGKNFCKPKKNKQKYIVEIREADSLYQTDLVEFIVRTATVLKSGKMSDQGHLIYEIYYALMRMGLRNPNEKSIYGMDEEIDKIIRGLIRPLANPDISGAIDQNPESALLVGVPGTGKTEIVRELLKRDTGLFILPIEAKELYEELKTKRNERKLLPRISSISRKTGKKVILHIDDIETMVQEGLDTDSSLLNHMQGLQEDGFYIIASTNDPEKIDPALIQPQRFGLLVYCGLQNKDARREILKLHIALQSKYSHYPLFTSDAIREFILDALVARTQYFTPRYLGKITTEAKAFLIERIAHEKGVEVGLVESDLQGYVFTPEDWENAFRSVYATYDKEGTKSRDGELQKFVKKQLELFGFKLMKSFDPDATLFNAEERAELANLAVTGGISGKQTEHDGNT